jgi:membrane protein
MPGVKPAFEWTESEQVDGGAGFDGKGPATGIAGLFKKALYNWMEDKAPRLGAALSYYTVFSLAPTLLIAIAIAGSVFGREAVEGRIFAEMSSLIGPTAAETVQHLLSTVYRAGNGFVASLVGFITLLIGATGVFVELQDALNTVFRVDTSTQSAVKVLLRDRLLSFVVLLAIAFILLVSFVASAALTAIARFIDGPGVLWHSLDLLLSFGVTAFLFALMFKLLPDVLISWRDCGVGAVVTALLFSGGKVAIGFYLGRSSIASTYGGTAAVMLLLIWVYYSAQIVIFGAEFTRVYSRAYGAGYGAARGARLLPDF